MAEDTSEAHHKGATSHDQHSANGSPTRGRVALVAGITGQALRTSKLLDERSADPEGQGRAAHEWPKGRTSHREAMRHMLSAVFPGIERPPAGPWDNLPGPWTRDG